MTAETPDNPGKLRVSAVIGPKVDALEREARGRIVWPAKGHAYNGVAPGQWQAAGDVDETGCLPADCPVRPMGYEGENFYLIDVNGQVFSTGGKAMGVERMQILFAGHEDFLCWAWPAFSGRGAKQFVSGFKAEEARRDLYAACAERGPWNPTDMVRGRGAWRDEEGNLVLHCGDVLYVGLEQTDTGEHGDYLYVRRPAANLPWGAAVDSQPAVQLAENFRTWQFVRGDIDVLLLLGWIGVSLLGAALDWRPSVFIIGDAGTGKSTLHKVIKQIMGRGMISTTNASEAGLYQIVGQDALPICIDEIEGDDAGDQAQKIITMARHAASGSVRIRGGQDHKGVEFAARSTFLFSAINPPPITRASLSRLALLQLRELPPGAKPPHDFDADTGRKLLRRVADHWQDFDPLLESYRGALFEAGHSSRGQDTFGTLLACAHLLLGDDGLDAVLLGDRDAPRAGREQLVKLLAGTLKASETLETAGGEANWSQCLEALFASPMDAFNKGERMTVGQLLDEVIRETNLAGTGEPRDGVEKLGRVGLGIVEKGRAFAGYGLAVPLSGVDINKLFVNTPWAGRAQEGSWKYALGQAPAAIVRRDIPSKGAANRQKTTERVMIAGTQRRCVFVGLSELRAWQAERE